MEFNLNFLSVKQFTKAILLTTLVFTLIGCNKGQNDNSEITSKIDETNNTENLINKSADMFSGCYTIVQGEPAQIKISLIDQGLVMQMKEPKSANRVWDTPEPLKVLPIGKSSNYFTVDEKNIIGLVGRPDNMFVLAYVDQAYANIDPLLDSQYLGYIVQGSNTIYKVECDTVHASEIPTSELPASEKTVPPTFTIQEERRISIKSAEHAKTQ